MEMRNEALLAAMLDWIGPEGRPYDEVMAAWRTSCPGLSIWEEGEARGFVRRVRAAQGGAMVRPTGAGTAWRAAQGDPDGKSI